MYVAKGGNGSGWGDFTKKKNWHKKITQKLEELFIRVAVGGCGGQAGQRN